MVVLMVVPTVALTVVQKVGRKVPEVALKVQLVRTTQATTEV